MILEVKVKPNSSKQELISLGEGKYELYIKSPPENNKANLELIKVMSKHFKKEIKILRGKTSRSKIIEVKDGN